GGAVWFGANNSCVQFNGNTWAQNGAGYGGGAISFGLYTPNDVTTGPANQAVTFTNESFTGNSAGSGEFGGGGAVHFGKGMPDLVIQNSTFQGNSSYYLGGGLSFTCKDCTIDPSPRVTIQNTVFWNNSSG